MTRIKPNVYRDKLVAYYNQLNASSGTPEVVEAIQTKAQLLYNRLPSDFDFRGLVDALFVLGVQPRADDPIFTRPDSPWATMKRMGQKEIIQGELTWITIESYEEYEGQKVTNSIITLWQYTAQFTFSQTLLFREGLPTREAAIAGAKAEIKMICDCELESLRAKMQQWEAASLEQTH